MAPRSRTGCLTCRQRKLKCSEEKPVCAQCMKANRECIPSSGITFRHQQNPSMNHGEASLKNFYGYKETFARETTWVQVPRDLKFVYTNNPYEDEEGYDGYAEDNTSFMADFGNGYEAATNKSEYDLVRELAQAAYPAYATQGLEALSAVASQDQYSYAPPPATMTAEHSPNHQNQAAASQNLDFILNPTPAGAAMSPHNSNIDPRLHSEIPVSQPPDSNHEQFQNSEHDSSTPSVEERLLRAHAQPSST